MTFGRFCGFLLFAVLMAAVGFGASQWYQKHLDDGESTEPPAANLQSATPTEIQAQGRLEPLGGTIAVSALPGEQIVQINVHVGQEVAEGEELAVLGSKEIREAEMKLAEAQETKAQAQLASEQALSQQRIRAAELAIKQAQAHEKELPPDELKQVLEERKRLAEERYAKLQQLRDNPATRDAIAATELEQQQLLIRQLDAEIQHTKNQGDVAITSQRLAVEAAELDLTMARLGDEGLQKGDPRDVMRWTTQLAQRTARATTVTAPSKGKILEIYARKGERVANTPILLMADLEQMICVAEVHEANLRDIKTKEENGRRIADGTYRATIKSVALAEPLTGEVLEVGQLIGAPELRDPNPLARSDHRTANVTIKLDEDSQEAARRFVHLQVNVTIQLP